MGIIGGDEIVRLNETYLGKVKFDRDFTHHQYTQALHTHPICALPIECGFAVSNKNYGAFKYDMTFTAVVIICSLCKAWVY